MSVAFVKPDFICMKCPLIDLRCPPARDRKNYQRLYYRYRGIAEKIGLHEWSAF
jgi:hypothetical protein